MARDTNAAGVFADVIGRAKDELVTPDEYHAFAHEREAFEFEEKTAPAEFEKTVDELRRERRWATCGRSRRSSQSSSKGPDAARKDRGREARARGRRNR